MEALAADHYMELLGEPVTRDFTLNLEALGLSRMEAIELELPFSEAEIWATI
jgi:hypothetical protein